MKSNSCSGGTPRRRTLGSLLILTYLRLLAYLLACFLHIFPVSSTDKRARTLHTCPRISSPLHHSLAPSHVSPPHPVTPLERLPHSSFLIPILIPQHPHNDWLVYRHQHRCRTRTRTCTHHHSTPPLKPSIKSYHSMISKSQRPVSSIDPAIYSLNADLLSPDGLPLDMDSSALLFSLVCSRRPH